MTQSDFTFKTLDDMTEACGKYRDPVPFDGQTYLGHHDENRLTACEIYAKRFKTPNAEAHRRQKPQEGNV